MIQDNRKTDESWAHDHLSYAMPGTLAAGDYLGDTAAGTGLPMPGCDIQTVHYNIDSTSGSGTEVTIHNVTAGESVTFTPSEGAATADVDLHFGVGDELAISVGAVDGTTAGSDLSVLCEYRKYRVSSTQHGD